MTSSIRQPFLPTSKSFPTRDLSKLESSLQYAYFETAQAVNFRTIGLHDKVQVTNGENWFGLEDGGNPIERRQGYRKVFTLEAIGTSTTGTIDHEITGITAITRLWATATRSDGVFIPIPYVSTAGTDPVGILTSDTQIIITNGSGTLSLSDLIVVVEYLLN